MKLDELRNKAKAGEANPEDLGVCQFGDCRSKATDRDEVGFWCWAHREASFRAALDRSSDMAFETTTVLPPGGSKK